MDLKHIILGIKKLQDKTKQEQEEKKHKKLYEEAEKMR